MIIYSRMTYIGGKGKLQSQHDIMIKYVRKGLYRLSKAWIQQLNEYLSFYKKGIYPTWKTFDMDDMDVQIEFEKRVTKVIEKEYKRFNKKVKIYGGKKIII